MNKLMLLGMPGCSGGGLSSPVPCLLQEEQADQICSKLGLAPLDDCLCQQQDSLSVLWEDVGVEGSAPPG